MSKIDKMAGFEDEMEQLVSSFEFGQALLKKFVADCRKMATRNWSKSDVEALNKLFFAVLSQSEYGEVECEKMTDRQKQLGWCEEAQTYCSIAEDNYKKISAEAIDEFQKWHLVDDNDFPKAEESVLLVAKHKGYKGKAYYSTFRGIYEDGTIHSEDSMWNWDNDCTDALTYCEETDDYIIGKGWYEESLYNPDNMSYEVEDEIIAWMELPKFESHDKGETEWMM